MYVCKGKGDDNQGNYFNCATYDGCVYDIYEASSFLQKYFLEKKIKIKINKGETITLVPMPALWQSINKIYVNTQKLKARIFRT